MIYDRTQSDVTEAAAIREEKVKTFQTLTEAEIETLERGTLTINTLNRIEAKQAELQSLMNEYGYYNTHVVSKTWTLNDVFRLEDFKRIIENDKNLKEAFFVFNDTPDAPLPIYGYEEINALEKILVDIEYMLDDMTERRRECNTFYCGEANEN